MIDKPISEASTPVGWPTPTPVGEIQIKEYPSARAAVAKVTGQSSEQNALFRRLFAHIKDNDIPMTAPVEMTYLVQYGDGNVPALDRQSMAFYYQDQTVGRLGAAGDVEVVDVPGVTVVSIGLKGSYSEANFQEAYVKLLRWLDEHSREYAVAGKVRVLTYNSPFVPFWMKYAEVQIPIDKVSPQP